MDQRLLRAWVRWQIGWARKHINNDNGQWTDGFMAAMELVLQKLEEKPKRRKAGGRTP